MIFGSVTVSNLEVGELRVVKIRIYVQGGSHYKQWLKLV